MGINLSQLKADKVRVTIPLYIADEFIDNIEVYNPTYDIVEKIKIGIQNQTYNDFEFKSELLKELTNINIDCELDDFYTKYYSEIFAQVMIEVDNIIFEILTNYMIEIEKLSNISPDKADVFNNIIEQAEKEYKNNETLLQEIEENKRKVREEKELQRQVEEATIKLKQLKGE
jgi:hypothetical protein